MTGRIRVGVIGIEHLHLFEMVDGLVRAGAEVAAVDAEPGPLLDLFGGWQPEARRVDRSAMLGDDSIDVIVLAGVPADRASVAVEALRAGKHVLAAKPAVTTAADLALVDAAATEHHRRWWVFFSERLTNRAVIEAVRLCGAGAIGRVVAVSGSAPHTLAAPTRPPWFFDTRRAGGILTDLAAHQADQFLSLAGPGTWEVTGARSRRTWPRPIIRTSATSAVSRFATPASTARWSSATIMSTGCRPPDSAHGATFA
ncbi:MAG: Gfo/Idh/MocA family oxidoreductase [Microthrixaceae bacterium]